MKHNINISSTYIIKNAIVYHIKLTKNHSKHRLYGFPNYKQSLELIAYIKKSARTHKPIALTHQGIRAVIYCVLELSANPLFSKVKYRKYTSAIGNTYNMLLNVFSSTMSKRHKSLARNYFKRHGMNPQSWVHILTL